MSVKYVDGWPINSQNKVVWIGSLSPIVGHLPKGVSPVNSMGAVVFSGSTDAVVGYITATPLADAITTNEWATSGLSVPSAPVRYCDGGLPTDSRGRIAQGDSCKAYLAKGIFPVNNNGYITVSDGGYLGVVKYVSKIPVDSATGAVLIDIEF